MKCPDCKGKGIEKVTGFFDYEDESQSGFEVDKPLPCSFCQGNGKVFEAQLKQRRIGQYVKARHVEMEITVREVAKLWGVSFSDIWDLYQGRFGFREHK